MDLWPSDLLSPGSENWRLQGVALSGGFTVGGNTKLTRTDGGGLWVGEQTFLFHSREQIKAARAIEAGLDGGAGQIVAWSYEEPFAPLGLSISSVPHSDGTSFSDGSEYLSVPYGAVTTASAALRATSMSVTLIAGDLQAGERFSIIHPTKGWRRYVISRVVDNVITFRPPLREAVGSGTELDFLRVGCVCRLANPDEFMGALDGNHMTPATARWVEAF